MTEVEQSQRHGRRGALVAPCYVWSHFYYPLLIVNLLIYSIKMILVVVLLSSYSYKFIDVNYVNVNAFYFYFTPILVEIDVKDNFYVLPCSYSQKG